MIPRPSRSATAGMSLVELLVAIAVSTIAFSTIMSLMGTGIRSLKKMEKQLAMTQQARLVLNRMVRELASAFHPYGMYGFIPYRETGGYKPWLIARTAASALATGGGKELSFVASLYQKNELEPDPGSNGDLCEIHYYLAGSATSASPRHLYRRKDMGVLGAFAPGTEGVGGDGLNIMATAADKWISVAGADAPTPIGFNVRDLNFNVYDRTGTLTALPFTYDATSAATGFPSRIRIFVTFYDPDAIAPDMTFATDVSVMRNN